MSVSTSVLDLMRNSPLVALKGASGFQPRSKLWGKLELALPGAMKDRVALNCVEEAERAGKLSEHGTIVESSSGTFAEGLARVGAIKGYRVIIVTDPRMDRSFRTKLLALGVRLDIVPESSYVANGGWQYARLCRLREILLEEPHAFWPRQYDNPGNPEAYVNSLAVELADALGPQISAVVAPVGSGGSISGIARGLSRRGITPLIVAVDAVGSVIFNQPEQTRMQSGHGNSIIPGNVNYQAIDDVHWLTDSEAFSGCRDLARREGIFAGGSSGAAYIVASWLSQQFTRAQSVVAIFPDRGERYCDSIYSDEFLLRHQLSMSPQAWPINPKMLKYSLEKPAQWSYAHLPHDGRVPYHNDKVKTSSSLVSELRLG